MIVLAILCFFWNMINHLWQIRITHDKWKSGPRTAFTHLRLLTDSYLSAVIHLHLLVTWHQTKNLLIPFEHHSNYFNYIKVFKGNLQSPSPPPPLCWVRSTSWRRKKRALLRIETGRNKKRNSFLNWFRIEYLPACYNFLMYIKNYRDTQCKDLIFIKNLNWLQLFFTHNEHDILLWW